ncbi:MAG TPA: pectinesterase family protein, partial [Longimicrobium sp.]|nr:pectinesterase family protein [Longimicrobium sp.]
QAADSAGLLSAERIAALPGPERAAWQRYLDTSGAQPDTGRRSIAERIQASAGVWPMNVQAVLDELDHVLGAQLPNGCWPRVYPLRGGADDAVAIADADILHVLHLLLRVARGDFPFVQNSLPYRAGQSLQRGVDCILESQVVVDGRRTGWGARLDPITLAPLGSGGNEPAGISARGTAGLLQFLLTLHSNDPRVTAAVHGAAAWTRETMLWGIAQAPGEKPVPTPGAGPLWWRLYETGWNRPASAGSDAWRDLPDGARAASARFTDAPGHVLELYDRWMRDRESIPLPPTHERPDAVVDARHGGADGAVVAGTPTYRTIGAALAAAPADGREAFVVAVRDGRYREKLSIQKPNIHLIGESRDGTVLTYDVAAGHISPGGWPYGTRGSWTLHVAAPGFRLERMTVENAFDFMGNAAKPDSDSTKLRGTQAVAVMLDEGSDRAVFRDCRLSGHQDTLFPNAGRSYFQHCEILGSVDFIFGAGRAVFDDCDIVSRDRGSVRNNGYITAPSTRISQPYGFVFVRSRLRKETPGMAP